MQRGRALRQVARAVGVSLSTVQLWVARAQHRPLDEVDWAGRSSRPRHTRRTRREVEDRVLQVRWQLDLQAPLRGQVIFVRRTSERGDVHLLGRTFAVDPLWCFRLVRCEAS